MPSAQGYVLTSRADRYASQLQGHLSRLRHGPGRHGSGDHGAMPVIEFQPTPEALRILVSAESDEALDQAREQVARRIATIGRRESLSVVWE